MGTAGSFTFEHVLLPTGWVDGVTLTVGENGTIATLTAEPVEGAEPVSGYAIPGMVNAHSHAFQYAMVGRAEFRAQTADSFWSWREAMYNLAGRIDPKSLKAIARYLYTQMLLAGYTGVCEFHYVHQQPGGAPYADFAIMSEVLFEAAHEVGLAYRHLPVFYQYGGFEAAPLSERQRRFRNDLNSYLKLLDACRKLGSTGVCFHSLRAVAMDDIMLAAQEAQADEPIHIHIAEQPAEVEACVSTYGRRPVDYLMDHVDLDARWNLVHATHLTEFETAAIAGSGAQVVLCPTTEANLGDGIFPLGSYQRHGGSFSIGTDSHVCLDPFEELRLLEYGQRLNSHNRNVYASPEKPNTGANLFSDAARGGANSMGRTCGAITAGAAADIVVIGKGDPMLDLAPAEQRMDHMVFAKPTGRVKDVMVGGAWKVRDGVHPMQSEAMAAFTESQKT